LTGCGLGKATLAMLPLCLGASWLCWRHTAPLRGRRAQLLTAAGLLTYAVCVFALYNHFFLGAVSISGVADAGRHVDLRHEFQWNPDVYSGFVTFYGLTSWLVRLFGLNDFFACTVAIYFIIAAFVAITWAVTAHVLWPASELAFARGLSAALLVQLLLLTCAVLPLFHYHQSEGYYGHLFSIVPLAMLWACDAAIAAPLGRWVAVAVCAVLVRYSYGIDLPNLSCALAIMLAWDAWTLGGKWRALLIPAFVVLGIGYHAFELLRGVYGMKGAFLAYDRWPVVVGQAALCAALAVFLPQDRWLRLPLFMGIGSTLFLVSVAPPPPSVHYYYYKTHVTSLMLMLAAAVPLAARAAESRRRKWPIWLLVLIAAGSLYRGLAPYRPTLVQRAFGKPPFSGLYPFFDYDAWARINRTLAEEHKRFGGYLTSFYPLMTFMNSSFGFFNGGLEFYYWRGPREEPGNCIFWEWCGDGSTCLEPFPQERRRRQFDSEPHQCATYHPHWNPEQKRTLCWRCQ
jgi:hypothetical protein